MVRSHYIPLDYVGAKIHLKDKVLTLIFFFSSRRRHTRYWRDWSSDVCFPISEFGVDRPLLLAEFFDAELGHGARGVGIIRSEERRVGKECRSRWSPYH